MPNVEDPSASPAQAFSLRHPLPQAVVLGLAVLGGLVGLGLATGGKTIEPALARTAVAVASGWSKESGPTGRHQFSGADARLSDAAHVVPSAAPSAAPAAAGDERFWLSRHDLTGGAVGVVGLGDRLTISQPQSSQPASGRVFEVVELRPLADLAAVVAPAAHGGDAASKSGVALTLVVCREVLPAGSAAEPQVMRFLMDSGAMPLAQPIGRSVLGAVGELAVRQAPGAL